MPLYYYARKKSSATGTITRIISFLCIFSGISLLIWVLFPILIFEIFYSPKFGVLVQPVPGTFFTDSIVNNLPQVLGSQSIDYTKASVWFPKASNLKLTALPAFSITSYTLDIPKLGIEKALVMVGGDDLTKSLIHFTGPLPANNGNPVIFGHSTLLWLYNPQDYKSIFSRLPDLNKDDNIQVTVDNIIYYYKVFEMKIISPDNLSVLEQNNDHAYITLVTCVPQGTYLKRFIVRGRLENI